jgi:hypothetical protein
MTSIAKETMTDTAKEVTFAELISARRSESPDAARVRREARVQRLARRCGHSVHKARGQQHVNNRGLYQLVHDYRNEVVLGDRFDATLYEIADFLSPLDERARQLQWRTR